MKKVFFLFIYFYFFLQILLPMILLICQETYIGDQCLKKCKHSSAVDKLIKKIPLLEVFQSKMKPGLLIV